MDYLAHMYVIIAKLMIGEIFDNCTVLIKKKRVKNWQLSTFVMMTVVPQLRNVDQRPDIHRHIACKKAYVSTALMCTHPRVRPIIRPSDE